MIGILAKIANVTLHMAGLENTKDAGVVYITINKPGQAGVALGKKW